MAPECNICRSRNGREFSSRPKATEKSWRTTSRANKESNVTLLSLATGMLTTHYLVLRTGAQPGKKDKIDRTPRSRRTFDATKISWDWCGRIRWNRCCCCTAFAAERDFFFTECMYVWYKRLAGLRGSTPPRSATGPKNKALSRDNEYNICLLYTSPSPRD